MNEMNATASITITAWTMRRRTKASMDGCCCDTAAGVRAIGPVWPARWVDRRRPRVVSAYLSKTGAGIKEGMSQQGIRVERTTKRPPEGGLESKLAKASSELERVLGAERVRRVARQAVAALEAGVEVQVGALAQRVVVAQAELRAVVVVAGRVEAVVRGLQVAGADRRQGAEAPELVR